MLIKFDALCPSATRTCYHNNRFICRICLDVSNEKKHLLVSSSLLYVCLFFLWEIVFSAQKISSKINSRQDFLSLPYRPIMFWLLFYVIFRNGRISSKCSCDSNSLIYEWSLLSEYERQPPIHEGRLSFRQWLCLAKSKTTSTLPDINMCTHFHWINFSRTLISLCFHHAFSF